MKKLLLLLFLLLPSAASAQTYLSAQSNKQAAATTQTITADGAGTAVDTTGYTNVLFTVRGTYVVVTIAFEASPDATNYFPVACARVDSSVAETASGALTNTTRAWRCNTTGFTRFRHNSDWTSSTVNVTITPVSAPSDLGVTVGQATAANLNATVTGTVGITANSAVNVAQINGVTTLMGNGATGTGSQRVTIASDNTAFSVNPLSATTPVSTMNSASANSGLNSALAGVFDDTSPTSITENSFGFLRMSANRNLFGTIRDAAGNERGANVDATNRLSVSVDNSNVSTNIAQMNGVAVTMGNGASGTGVQRVTIASDSTGVVGLSAGSNLIGQVATVATATTTNAASTSYLTSAASTNSTNVKASAGNVYAIRAINTTATLYYLRMYNLSSAPTCSSATGFIETIPIPASTAGGGFTISQTVGQAYSTGIGFCITGGGSSTDNTNAATGVYLTILFK